MIKRFSHKGLKELFERGQSKKVSASLSQRLIRQLDLLHSATSPQDMNLPGYHLHALKGARAGSWAVTVTGNWRLTFTFEQGDAFNVDLEDYH